VPWFWTRALLIHQRMKGIIQSAAYDPEKLVAPKEIWMNDESLEAWYEERRNLRKDNADRGTV